MPRSLKCSFRENGRQCPRKGTGNPPLCQPHKIAVMEASRPRRPGEVLADALVNFLQGNPINVEATVGAADALLSQWKGGLGSGYQPDVGPARGAPPPWWYPMQTPASEPETPAAPAADLQQLRAARGVLGFTHSEPLTGEKIGDRRKVLAKKFHPDRHPDRVAWATEQMTVVNAAADILLQAL